MSGLEGVPKLKLGPRALAALAALRARIRLALLGRGGARLVLVALLLGAISYGLDRPLRLDWTPRLALWLVGMALLLAELWRRVLRPGLRELPDVELARAYERTHPSLGWRLLSAVQFAAGARAVETSAALAAGVVQDAEAAAGGLAAAAAVPAKPVAQRLGLAALGVLLAALLCGRFPDEARTWALRNLLLSPSVRWPQDTYLELLSFNGKTPLELRDRYAVARGADVELVVGVRQGEVPRRVYLLTDGLPGGDQPAAFDDLGQGKFRILVQRVANDFSFEVEGNDEHLGPYAVTAVVPPFVQEVRLAVEPPAYTKKPQRELALDSGNLSFPVGTKLTLTATVSKNLTGGWLVAQDAASKEPRRLAGELLGSAQEGTKRFQVSWTLEDSGQYELGVLDHEGAGLEAPPRFGVVAIPDQSPSARLELEGVGLNVTAEAVFSFKAGAEDDYGLGEGALHVRPSGRPPAPTPPAPKPGEPPKPVPARPADEVVIRPLPGLAKDGKEQGSFDLTPLKLEPKMAVTVWVEVRDENPRGKQAGSSPSVALRVVSPEQLLNELLRRLYEERQQLERMAGDEEGLARELASLGPEALKRGPATQRDVTRVVARAGERVERVVVEMISNKLLDQATWSRLREQVVKGLDDLTRAELAAALGAAEAAAQAEAGALGPLAEAAAETSRAVAVRLRAIVELMGRIEELAEVVSQLKRIIRKQRDLMDETRKQKGN
ncbi:MAG: hypothetical protein AB7N76_10610 [Planctomycetota bacterium]